VKDLGIKASKSKMEDGEGLRKTHVKEKEGKERKILIFFFGVKESGRNV
jgi:hypothetical protein